MNANHHIPPHILSAYALGTLPEAFSLVVACHISMCDQCRVETQTSEAMAGAFLDDLPEIAMAKESFAATMARIQAEAAVEIAPTRRHVAARGAVFPKALQEYAGSDPSEVKWRGLGGGVRQALLPSSGFETVRLLYIPAGRAMPDHSHSGLELTLVLQGAFSDEFDRFKRGDVEIGDESITHTPIAEMGADCICLAATAGPLKFKTLLPKLFQPFFRI